MKEPITTEKVTDASLTRSIISSVIGIVLCMACLFGTTWAWYSSSVTSGVSVTEGANFDFDISIEDSITPTDGVYTFAGGEHTVTLTKMGTVAKGFCKVVATKNGEDAETTTYYIVDFTDEETVEFTVTGPGTLKLIPMLGTPAEGYDPIPEDGINLTTPVPTLLDALLSMMTDQGDTEDPTESAEVTGQTEPEAPAEQPTETPTEPEAPTEQPAETTTQ